MNGDLTATKKSKKSFYKKLTRTEIILAVALAGVTIFLIHCKFADNIEIVLPSECADSACYESIIEINNFIDPSVDPCEDFHQFVCGNFLETAYKKQIVSKILQEEQELQNELDAMIVEPVSSKDSEAIKIQKMFFRACMNVEDMDANWDERVLDLIDQIGGAPLLNRQAWKEEEFDWINVMIQCKKLGLPFQWFLEFGLHPEDANYLQISYPTPHNQSKNHMTNVLSGFLRKNTNVKEIFEFEKRLTDVLRKQKSEISVSTIQELHELHPLFNWLDVVNNITENSFELSEDSEIASNVKGYIVSLYQLLKGTPKRTQANYIVWKIIEYFAPFLSKPVRHQDSRQITRSEFCKEKTTESFPFFTEIEYIKRYAKTEIKESAKELTNMVRKEFLSRIEDSTWWNTTAGEIYLEMFDNTEIEIGLDFDNTDEVFVDENYLHLGNLTFGSEKPNIIEMITERSKHYYHSVFGNINKTAINPEEKLLPLQIMQMDILFHDSLKKMIVPPSILHGFLYDYKRPKYLNFASLGTLLAREFIASLHLLTENDKNVTNVAFEASTRCLEDDYSDMESQESTNIVDQVLPDIIARDIAYTAYQKWVESNEEESKLPLLSFSPNQLFWIKSSLINCYKKLTDETDLEVRLSKYKNVLSVRHSRHFSEDFGCPEKTSMNPSSKC